MAFPPGALITPGEYLASLEGGGRVTVPVAGTRVQLSATEESITGVVIQALETNTGFIAFAGDDVVAAVGTRVGIVLSAEASYVLPVRDLRTVFIDATVSGDGIGFLPLKG